jgi:hypothetical protein
MSRPPAVKLSRKFGVTPVVSESAIRQRMREGMSFVEAATTPRPPQGHGAKALCKKFGITPVVSCNTITRRMRGGMSFAEAAETYEKRIKRDKEKSKSKAPKDEFGLRAQAIASALRNLTNALTITPDQVLKAERLVSKITGQSVGEGLRDEIADAKTINSWVANFLKQTGGLK